MAALPLPPPPYLERLPVPRVPVLEVEEGGEVVPRPGQEGETRVGLPQSLPAGHEGVQRGEEEEDEGARQRRQRKGEQQLEGQAGQPHLALRRRREEKRD